MDAPVLATPTVANPMALSLRTEQPHPSSTQQSLILRASCDSCSKAKVRCDRAKPCCQRCQQRDIKCHYGFSQRSGRKRRLRHLDDPTNLADARKASSSSISSSSSASSASSASSSSSSTSSPDLKPSAAQPYTLSPSHAFLSSEHMSSAFGTATIDTPGIADDYNFWDPWTNTNLYAETPSFDVTAHNKQMPLMLNTAFEDPMMSEQSHLDLVQFESHTSVPSAPNAYVTSPTVYSSIEPSTVSPASLRRASSSPSPEKESMEDKVASLTASVESMQKRMEDLTRQRDACPATCSALLNVLVDMQHNDLAQARCKDTFGHSHAAGEARLRQSVSELHHELLRLKDGMESIKQQHWMGRH